MLPVSGVCNHSTILALFLPFSHPFHEGPTLSCSAWLPSPFRFPLTEEHRNGVQGVNWRPGCFSTYFA